MITDPAIYKVCESHPDPDPTGERILGSSLDVDQAGLTIYWHYIMFT